MRQPDCSHTGDSAAGAQRDTAAAWRNRGRIKRERGYTIVELMMAVTIFGIGVSGIAAMQILSASANAHAKDLAVATQLARSWQEKLAMDSTLWGGKQMWQRTQTTWINQEAVVSNAWFQPGLDAATAPAFGPAAGPMGNFVNHTTSPQDVVFCTHIRLTPIDDVPGSQLMRTEVRVFWPKGETSYVANSGNYCDGLAGTVTVVAASSADPALAQFHFVYKTSAVREFPVF